MTSLVRALRTLITGASLVAAAGNTAIAQVGHLPSKSPYEDLKPTQDLTLFAGHFGSEPGSAGVLPKPSLFGGVRYDLPIAGPAYFTARYIFWPSERRFLLPSNNATTRYLGTTNTGVHAVDVGFNISLTGRKTWHRLMPGIAFGTGLASDFAKADTGGYKFGTKFDFTFGGNVSYIMRNGMGIRADATNYFWKNTYPEGYVLKLSADTTSVLSNTAQRTGWKGNWALSLGFFIPIFR